MAAIYADLVTRDSEYARRVGSALETVRLYRRMSQVDLAAAAGTSVSTISRYENGHDQRGYTMVSLARALRVPLELLMDPPETPDDVLLALAHHIGRQRADELEPS